MQRYIFEIFDDLRAADGERGEIVKIIKENKSKNLAILFMAAYGHPRNRLNREDLPEYREDDAPLGMTFTTLAKELSRLEYFFDPGKPIKKPSLIRMYVNICEGLHPKEAELFTDIITKELYVKGLTRETINAGFGEEFLQKPEKELEDVD